MYVAQSVAVDHILTNYRFWLSWICIGLLRSLSPLSTPTIRDISWWNVWIVAKGALCILYSRDPSGIHIHIKCRTFRHCRQCIAIHFHNPVMVQLLAMVIIIAAPLPPLLPQLPVAPLLPQLPVALLFPELPVALFIATVASGDNHVGTNCTLFCYDFLFHRYRGPLFGFWAARYRGPLFGFRAALIIVFFLHFSLIEYT